MSNDFDDATQLGSIGHNPSVPSQPGQQQPAFHTPNLPEQPQADEDPEGTQEMLAHVLTVIRRRMNEHGELIIAVDPSSAASGLQVQAIQTDDGRKWWAAFTSFDEELKGSGSVEIRLPVGVEMDGVHLEP